MTESEAKTRSESLSRRETGIKGESSFCRLLPLLSNRLVLQKLYLKTERSINIMIMHQYHTIQDQTDPTHFTKKKVNLCTTVANWSKVESSTKPKRGCFHLVNNWKKTNSSTLWNSAFPHKADCNIPHWHYCLEFYILKPIAIFFTWHAIAPPILWPHTRSFFFPSAWIIYIVNQIQLCQSL